MKRGKNTKIFRIFSSVISLKFLIILICIVTPVFVMATRVRVKVGCSLSKLCPTSSYTGHNIIFMGKQKYLQIFLNSFTSISLFIFVGFNVLSHFGYITLLEEVCVPWNFLLSCLSVYLPKLHEIRIPNGISVTSRNWNRCICLKQIFFRSHSAWGLFNIF